MASPCQWGRKSFPLGPEQGTWREDQCKTTFALLFIAAQEEQSCDACCLPTSVAPPFDLCHSLVSSRVLSLLSAVLKETAESALSVAL